MAENPIFSYTKRDYEGSRKEGLAKIPILSEGKWTDLNATDPGIIILDYVHALVDMINYYQDHQALEAFISTAKERANIFRLAKQLSYEIRSAQGATCNVEFTSTLIYDYIIKIPKYTNISTESGINYLTKQDGYLLAGEVSVEIPCSQGILHTITYQGNGISRFSNIDGAKDQSLRIVDNNIEIDSITITDNIGRLWKPVDYITFSNSSDRVYQVELNPDNSISIKFGNGERGVVPKETDILTINYISTSAEEGRVGANSLVILKDIIYDDKGHSIEFLVSNRTASIGGSQVQSSQEIRELAPGVIKAQDRAVTLSDFENLAKLVDGVSDARAYDINTKPDLCLYHEVKVLITPKDTAGSLESLNKRVYDFLSKKILPPTNLQILSPSYIPIDISIVVKKLDTANAGSLSYTIQQYIESYFNDRIENIGEVFDPLELSADINRLDGVRYVVSIEPNEVIQLADLSVPKLGKLDIQIV